MDQGVAQIPTGLSSSIRGEVTIRDRQDHVLDANGKATNTTLGSLIADFADYSTLTSTPAPLMDLTNGCGGVIGRPLKNGDLKRLRVGSLTLKGSSIGDVHPTETSTGVYSSMSAQLLMAQGGDASLRVVGTMMDFPAFDESLSKLSAVEVSEPKLDGTAELKSEDLVVTWKEGDGDWTVIQIVPDMPTNSNEGGGQVVCFVADKGCFTIPALAGTFLLAARSPTYSLSVERHRFHQKQIDTKSGVQIEAIAETRLTLKNGVISP
jgi:hypothetical protein